MSQPRSQRDLEEAEGASIRDAHARDRDAIAALVQELHPDQGPFDPLKVRQGHRTFVAEEAGRVVGVLFGTFTHYGLDRESAGHLEQLVVAADARRRGIGEALVEEWKQWLVSEGIALGFVSTTDELDAARFYERCGFTLCAGPFLVWAREPVDPRL